eukprot:gene2857-biopygen3625
MFSITVPNVDLPVDLGFTQDFDLKLAIGDDGDVVVCGRHWTLFTTVTQPMADFEAAYGIMQQTAMVSCAAAAAAEPPPLDIDDSCMPFDKLTYAVVVALEELVDNSCCPNTRVFAWLYAKHLRAADMDFMDLLQTPAIANMASTALDAWFVRHPMFRAQAHEAQDLLITVLDEYTPSRPRYEPYWGEDNHHLKRCKEELDGFLRKVMPVDEERDVVLAFFAGLLSGRRKEKKFLAFTDKTSGDNGKSTLMALLGSFFDEYGSSNGTKFMTKGSFARSRDDHDAGLKPMKGVRLLVAEEMKPNITLDEAFIKRIAGGEGVRVCGSSCDTGNSFDFLWQAGIVLVFNEGDCPKFDGGDTAFVKRMVVVPMRSNFVLHPEREHEFERRDNLEDALPTWRSAMAQLLIEHFLRPGRSSIFDNLPV